MILELICFVLLGLTIIGAIYLIHEFIEGRLI